MDHWFLFFSVVFGNFCWCWRPWTLSCHDPQIDFFVLLLNTHFLFLVFQEINCSFILFMLKLIYDKSLWYTILFLVTVFFFLVLWTIYNLDFLFVIRQSLFVPISFYIIINWFHHLTPKTWRRKKKISFMLVLLWLSRCQAHHRENHERGVSCLLSFYVR